MMMMMTSSTSDHHWCFPMAFPSFIHTSFHLIVVLVVSRVPKTNNHTPTHFFLSEASFPHPSTCFKQRVSSNVFHAKETGPPTLLFAPPICLASIFYLLWRVCSNIFKNQIVGVIVALVTPSDNVVFRIPEHVVLVHLFHSICEHLEHFLCVFVFV